MSTRGIIPNPEKTLGNLLIAFNGESNAEARYAAFALKADEEGLRNIASLFRAASRAEQIHAANHAALIQKLGATPQCVIEPAEVKTTAENLQEAIQGELYEVNSMYPGFVREAEEQKLGSKVRSTFKYALEAERDHARLFVKALEQIQESKDGSSAMLAEPASYCVCPQCGFTAGDTMLCHCPICCHARNEFEVIN